MLDWLMAEKPHLEMAQRHKDGRLAQELPEVDCLYDVPQTPEHHPEVFTGTHIELCLEVAAELSPSFDVRFATLVHDLGKGLTPKDEWPKHVNHEHAGLVPVKAVCDRLHVDARTERLALLVCKWHLHCHRLFEMNVTSVARFIGDVGLEQDAALTRDFVFACEADKRGRGGRKATRYLQGEFLVQAQAAIAKLPFPPGVTYQMPEGDNRHKERITAVNEIRKALRSSISSDCGC